MTVLHARDGEATVTLERLLESPWRVREGMRAALAMASGVVMNGLVFGSAPAPPLRLPDLCTCDLHQLTDLNSPTSLLSSLWNWQVRSRRIFRQACARSSRLSVPVRPVALVASLRIRSTSSCARPCSVPSSTSLSTAQPA